MTLPAAKTVFGQTPGLLLALGGSLLLHGVALLAIPVASPAPGTRTHVMEARLLPSATVTTSVAPSATRPAKSLPADAPSAAAMAETQLVPAQPDTTSPVTTSTASIPDTSTYFTNEQLDVPPHFLGELQQIYPARARTDAVEGYVTLSLLINEHGEVEDASVVQAHPAGYFEEAALSMLRKQRFSPPIKQNRPVRSRWQTTVRYRLQS